MRKYSFEFKKKVVMDYLEGKEGYKRLRKKYGMPDTHQIRTWISSYKKFGDKGIMGSNKNRTYSFDDCCGAMRSGDKLRGKKSGL